MYDLIGDIHGHAGPLKRLLAQMGYQVDAQGVWRHPARKVIFLGDFIDRGPEQREVVEIARAMVANEAALAVMGNHEFNAILYATEQPGSPGTYLRKHSDKNWKQHRAFLKAVGADGSNGVTGQQRELVDWFKTLPLYLDLDELRVVHACWHRPSLEVLAPYLDDHQRFLQGAWLDLATRGSPAYEAAEILLKGLEIPLPADIEFLDKDGNPRRQIRTRWWETAHLTYRDLAIVPANVIERIPHTPVEADVLPGYDGDKPLFVGHYWLDGEPEPLTDHIACLDYSVARQDVADATPGKLCAYRFDGEAALTKDAFVCAPG